MPERTFSVETPVKGFAINVCFNQFSVEKDSGWSLLTVGYITKGRLLDDVFSFALPKEALDLSRESVLQYLGRTGEILPMEHFIVPPASKVIPANIIGMSFRVDVGEVTLGNFTFKRINVDSGESAFEAEPVALLRSPLNVQKNLIKTLYQ